MTDPILISDGTATLTLPGDLLWTDENSWHPVEQATERTITGALIVSVAARAKGRPITLAPEDDGSAWMTRSTLEALRNLAAAPGKVMTLTLRGVSYSVMFRHHDGAAVDASPVVHFSDVEPGDYYRATLRLMEV